MGLCGANFGADDIIIDWGVLHVNWWKTENRSGEVLQMGGISLENLIKT